MESIDDIQGYNLVEMVLERRTRNARATAEERKLMEQRMTEYLAIGQQ